jgi:hypothetical protein
VSTVSEADLRAHVTVLASDAFEGRDSPSLGLELAARYIEQRFAEYGVQPLSGASYRLPFPMRAAAPVEAECWLELRAGEAEPERLILGRDFVPMAGCEGAAEGELVFLGFGIDAAKEHYDEVPARGLERNVAVILESEPRHRKRFDGEETSTYAVLWNKLVDLADAGAGGVIVVRRACPQRGSSTRRWPAINLAAPRPRWGARHHQRRGGRSLDRQRLRTRRGRCRPAPRRSAAGIRRREW